MKSEQRESEKTGKGVRIKRECYRRKEREAVLKEVSGKYSKRPVISRNIFDVWFPGGC